MIEHRECVGEQNCLERAAPSYHSRRSVPGEHRERSIQSPLFSFSRAIDLHRIDLGMPLAPGRL